MRRPTANVDTIYRVAYQTPSKLFSLGGSYYLGQINDPDTGLAATSILNLTGSRYTGAKKELYGADTQIAIPTGASQISSTPSTSAACTKSGRSLRERATL